MYSKFQKKNTLLKTSSKKNRNIPIDNEILSAFKLTDRK